MRKNTDIITPFGVEFIEELKDEKLPAIETWSWKPEIKPRKDLIKASWPGRTCTRNCNDERRDEM